MADTEKRRMKPFNKFLLIYVAVLTVLVLAGLLVFRQFISAYEFSRPVKATDRFFDELTPEYVRAHAEDYVAELSNKAQSDEVIFDYLFDCVRNADCVRAAGESTPTSAVYVLRHSGKNICRLYLEQETESSFGFSAWNVNDVEFNFSPLFVEDSISVPDGYSVLFEGEKLGSDFITDNEVHYAILDDFYDNVDARNLPYLTGYSVSHTLDTAVTVKAPDGKTYAPEELSEKSFINNLSKQELE